MDALWPPKPKLCTVCPFPEKVCRPLIEGPRGKLWSKEKTKLRQRRRGDTQGVFRTESLMSTGMGEMRGRGGVLQRVTR